MMAVWSYWASLGSIIGDAVVNVYINQEKKFAFVEMRTVEEASNAMALDGIIFEVTGFLRCNMLLIRCCEGFDA